MRVSQAVGAVLALAARLPLGLRPLGLLVVVIEAPEIEPEPRVRVEGVDRRGGQPSVTGRGSEEAPQGLPDGVRPGVLGRPPAEGAPVL